MICNYAWEKRSRTVQIGYSPRDFMARHISLYGDNGDPKVELLSSKSIFVLGVSFNLLNEDLQELESLSLRPMQIQLIFNVLPPFTNV